jgi:hypothetical protein
VGGLSLYLERELAVHGASPPKLGRLARVAVAREPGGPAMPDRTSEVNGQVAFDPRTAIFSVTENATGRLCHGRPFVIVEGGMSRRTQLLLERRRGSRSQASPSGKPGKGQQLGPDRSHSGADS